jgi:hypothetical protein
VRPRILVSLVAVALAVCGTVASADGTRVARIEPAPDVSLPFWCDWGYDWDERCYRDDGDRLPIGGDDDKLWRAALRFSTSSVPQGSIVVRATLHLHHDGRCLGPRKTQLPCAARTYVLTAHPILSPDWFRERELDFAPAISEAELGSADRPQRISFDVTELVAEWIDGSRGNAGVLVKLGEDHEDLGVSGPSVPSSSFGQAAVRPQLEISYQPPSG